MKNFKKLTRNEMKNVSGSEIGLVPNLLSGLLCPIPSFGQLNNSLINSLFGNNNNNNICPKVQP